LDFGEMLASVGVQMRYWSIMLGLAGLVGATTLERLSMDEMIAKSTSIVRARVLGSSVQKHGALIYTHYSVQVLERWKGAAVGQEDIVVPGGALTTGTGTRASQSFAGTPSLTVDSELVLFLWTGKSGLTHVIGLSQGVFKMQKDAAGESMVTRASIAAEMVQGSSSAPVRDTGVQMRFRDFDSYVKNALGGKKQ
jgi:hypothetical protein